MGTYSKQELEDAFAEYQRVAAVAARTGEWGPWADLFTEDATYEEHVYGTFHGRDEIAAWISHTMAQPGADQMTSFPIAWYIIDEDRGWIVCQVWNRMADPGDGSVHQAYNFTLLKYAGNGKWSYEEDIYNPARFESMLKGWAETKQRITG